MKEKIESMYMENLSCREIGRELGISHTTVIRILNGKGYNTGKKANKEETNNMIEMYDNGFSFSQIGKAFGYSRQSVWERLKRAGVKARKKKVLPFIVYDGRKWTINNMGYYRNTNRAKGEYLLHRYKYIREIGKIPLNYDIHHIDGNKENNEISNLLLISKSEHTKLHNKEVRYGNNNV